MNKSFINQKKYIYLTSLLPRHALMDYILVIFYLTKLSIGIDKYFYLDTLLFLLISILEIPSGYISDRLGKKNILIIGKIIVLISMICLLISTNFFGGIITIILLSLGTSLVSGNSEAILYDYYTDSDNLDCYKYMLSNAYSINLLLNIVLALLSGIIFKWNIIYIIYIDIFIYLINIIVTIMFLVEKKYPSLKDSTKKRIKIKEFIDIKIIFSFIIASLLFVYFRTTYNFYQPIYKDFKIDIKFFGIFPILFNIIGIITNQILKKFFLKKIKYNNFTIIKIYIFIFLTSILIMYSKYNFYIFIFIIIIQQIIRNVQMNIVPIYVNEKIPNETPYRTTYISVYNFISTGLVSITMILSGFLIKFFELYNMFFLISLIFIFLVIILNIYLKLFD